MKRKNDRSFKRMARAYDQEIVFMPALTPLEAAMLPAREERRACGALAHARQAFDAALGGEQDQRQKIWVR